MITFDNIYNCTLLEKYGSDGEYIAPYEMDTDFQRLFMLNIVNECAYTIQKFVDHRLPASEYPDLLKKLSVASILLSKSLCVMEDWFISISVRSI